MNVIQTDRLGKPTPSACKSSSSPTCARQAASVQRAHRASGGGPMTVLTLPAQPGQDAGHAIKPCPGRE
ncbi:MAG TPA: hypothetical protein VF838_14655 [Trebonia sp.]